MQLFETQRLILEPQMATHAAEMFAVLSDPAIYEFENEPPSSVDALRARFTRLESRQSPDGREQWLNWVIRVPASGLIGYVQTTVREGGHAAIAYELSSAHWSRGFASEAVLAMIGELVGRHEVRTLSAVLKRDNFRSMKLLQRLGFKLATPLEHIERDVEPGEVLMQRLAA